MIELDGSQKSGSGTIVRDAVSLAALTGRKLHLKNIRARRDKPGLRPQHLKGVEACRQLCRGELSGAEVGSKEIWFKPGPSIQGGHFNFDIGTAGSATMLASILLPLALFAEKPSSYNLTGGLFQDYAPSAYHLKYVLLPLLQAMGAELELKITRPGYVPRGGGVLALKVKPLKDKLKPVIHQEQGNIIGVRGIALSSLLQKRKVSERMAEECRKKLQAKGYHAHLEQVYDQKESPAFEEVSFQAGAALAIWARTDQGGVIGSDMAGAPRRAAEYIGRNVARYLIEDLKTGASVDRHQADQLIPFCALAEGTSEYIIPRLSEHLEARLWLVEEILGAKSEVKNNRLTIEGTGFLRGGEKWA